MIYLTCRVRGRPLASFRSEIAGAASGAVRWNPPDSIGSWVRPVCRSWVESQCRQCGYVAFDPDATRVWQQNQAVDATNSAPCCVRTMSCTSAASAASRYGASPTEEFGT